MALRVSEFKRTAPDPDSSSQVPGRKMWISLPS